MPAVSANFEAIFFTSPPEKIKCLALFEQPILDCIVEFFGFSKARILLFIFIWTFLYNSWLFKILSTAPPMFHTEMRVLVEISAFLNLILNNFHFCYLGQILCDFFSLLIVRGKNCKFCIFECKNLFFLFNIHYIKLIKSIEIFPELRRQTNPKILMNFGVSTGGIYKI